MKKHLKAFFIFLLPFLKIALKDVTVSAVTKFAYPDEPPPRRRVAYDRRATMNLGRAFNEAQATRRVVESPYDRMSRPRDAFHDVLMVAFDISGPNQAFAEEFIMNYLPLTGRQVFRGQSVNLDSWWIADDNRTDESDTDSAVFVTKGKQEEARKLLREHGLVD